MMDTRKFLKSKQAERVRFSGTANKELFDKAMAILEKNEKKPGEFWDYCLECLIVENQGKRK